MKLKRFKQILLAATLLSTPLLYSCLDDNEYYSVSLATIKVIEDRDYYFLSDKSNKIYPGDTTYIHNYRVEDGQRVFVYFDQLKEEIKGYDYNARLRYIQNILTKGIFPITEEKQDSIGDDKANLTALWFGGDHLNIRFQVRSSISSSTPHLINLVKDENTEDDDEYINLEFRHNAMDNIGNEVMDGIVSIKPPFTNDSSKKGLRIRVNTIYDGIKYYTIDFNDKDEVKVSESAINSFIRVE